MCVRVSMLNVSAAICLFASLQFTIDLHFSTFISVLVLCIIYNNCCSSGRICVCVCVNVEMPFN